MRREMPRPTRGASVRVRRTRTALGLGLLVVLGVALATCIFPASTPVLRPHPRPRVQATEAPAAEAGLLPWELTAPLSREVVLPGPNGQLVILGGLTTSSSSADGVYELDTATGRLRSLGTLPAPVHDATGAVVNGSDVVFGGGSPNTVAAVQAFPVPTGASSSSAVGTVLGGLPDPRSDAASATIGSTTYLVGGYTGSAPDPAVLATTNGRTFVPVVSLPMPVRYPAVAALDGKLYVFGGEALFGSRAGQPVGDIQVVDPARRTARIAGRLPEPLEGAAAVNLDGEIFVAGGDSSVLQPSTPGLGTTQIGPPGSKANPGAGASGAITDAYVTPPNAGPGANTTVHSLDASTSSTVSTVWAFDVATDRLLLAGRLQAPVSHAGVAVVGSRAWIVGGESNGAVLPSVQMLTPNRTFGTAGAAGAGSPYFGAKLLVADRGNNRLLLMDSVMHVDWTYPSATSPPDALGFYFPDDAFFIDKGTAIISNQEENETIVEIGYPSGRIVWSYGHPKQAGSAPGYLHEPDDAYLLRNGQISVADAQNCRVLVLDQDGTTAHQIGTTGRCVHNPPVSMGSPNGDTPLADGNLLVSEINGSWVTEYTTSGALVWTVHLPIGYPSDPQQIGANLYLIANYATPGQILEFNRQGQILYRYDVPSGPGMLNHPSLVEQLPNGVLMANDDYRNRMVAVDPATGALVWQYGVNDTAGTAPGMLNTPDGFDILLPNGSTPTHPATG